MRMRSELSPTYARELFSRTSHTNPVNIVLGFGPRYVMRGGIRF